MVKPTSTILSTESFKKIYSPLLLFILLLNYELRTSIYLIKENGFTQKRQEADNLYDPMTDADYADDQALLTNIPTQVESLEHSQEQVLNIDLKISLIYHVNYICSLTGNTPLA